MVEQLTPLTEYPKIFPFLDLQIYSNSVQVLRPTYETVQFLINKQFSEGTKCFLTKEFVQQSLQQLYKTNDEPLQRIMYEIFERLLKEKFLQNDELKQKLFATASWSVKNRANNLPLPYEIILEFVEQGYSTSNVYDLMDYYVNHLINSFFNQSLDVTQTVAATLRVFVERYKLSTELKEQKVFSLLKLAAEAELQQTKKFALICLAQLFPVLDDTVLANRVQSFFFSVMAAFGNARGIEREELRQLAADAFSALQSKFPHNLLNQFVNLEKMVAVQLQFVSYQRGEQAG